MAGIQLIPDTEEVVDVGDIKLGSLFDGSGGFPLAGAIFDIRPVWASEIEPYPIRVTTARFPEMKHLGDITKINGAEIEAVDIITFGSPCQDLSVAGKRLGLEDGERSNLFYQAVRIIKEMREATNGEYPKYAVWENVPGAFSSNNGRDFQAVLQNLCQVKDPNAVVPEPAKGKWQHAGAIVADGYSVAWRLYDAQFWGVPQRRKRIYLIADFTTDRAPEVLFEQESLRGDTETGTAEREDPAPDAAGSVGRSCAECIAMDGYNASQSDKASTLGVNCGMSTGRNGVCLCLNDQGGSVMNVSDKPGALRAQMKHHEPIACYSLEGNGCRPSHQGCGYSDDGAMYTLNTIEQHGVAYSVENHPNDSRVKIDEHGKVQTLNSRMGTGGNNVPLVLCAGNGQAHDTMTEMASTLNCMYDQPYIVKEEDQPHRKYIVRRLTPLECCRLQGFPDWWTDGVDGSDSAKYKMWGNGIALPCAVDVIGRLADALRNE